MDRTEYSLRLMADAPPTHGSSTVGERQRVFARIRPWGRVVRLRQISATATAAALLAATVIAQSVSASCPLASFSEYQATDANIVVAPWGDDDGDGSPERPVRSLKRASYLAEPGSVVLLRGGVYTERQVIEKGGRDGQPVVFAAWPEELPIVDGSDTIVKPNQGLVQINASDVVVDGIEVRHSSGRGVSVYDSDRVTLRRAHVHDIASKGFSGSGDDLVVESSVFENLVTENVDGAGPRPWPAGIATWHRPGGKPVSGFKLINSEISRVWGECVGLVFAQDAQVVGNRISDCYSVGVYLDNTRETRVERNIIFSNSDEFNRVDNGRAMVAVNLAVENYGSASPMMVSGIVISNNLIRAVDRGIGFFDDRASKSEHNSYRDVLVAHNAICGTRHAAISFPASRGSLPVGNRLVNNILCASKSSKNTVKVEQPEGWLIDHNAYPDGVTRRAGRNHVALSSTPGTGEGKSLQDWRIDSDSSLTGRALPLAEVTQDALCSPRSDTAASIGPLEP